MVALFTPWRTSDRRFVKKCFQELPAFGKCKVNLEGFPLIDFDGYSPVLEFLRRQEPIILLLHNWHPVFSLNSSWYLLIKLVILQISGLKLLSKILQPDEERICK